MNNTLLINNEKNFIIKNEQYNKNIIIDNANVLFVQCIFKNNTNIIIRNNSKINFKKCDFIKNYNNIITSNKSKIYFNNCKISNNYSNNESLLIFNESNIIFNGNTKIYYNSSKNNNFLKPLYGSIIYSNNSHLKICNNCTINNNNNYGNWNFGLIYNINGLFILTDYANINSNNCMKSTVYNELSNIKIENNVKISNNQSYYLGNILLKSCYTTISDYVIFKNNINFTSGVITCTGQNNNLILKNNIIFDSNILYPKLNQFKKINLCGTCLYINTFSENVNVLIKDNVKFCNNENKKGFGGAIYFGSYFKTNFTENILKIKDNVSFNNNSAMICDDIYTCYNLFIDKFVKFNQCFIKYINNIEIKSFLKFKNNFFIHKSEFNDIDKNINLNLVH
jgi:hypothetical protein